MHVGENIQAADCRLRKEEIKGLGAIDFSSGKYYDKKEYVNRLQLSRQLG